jgi:glucose/arabinose dehydrogenase
MTVLQTSLTLQSATAITLSGMTRTCNIHSKFGSVVLVLIAPILGAFVLFAQQGGRASLPLPPLPQTFETAQQRVRVSSVATGLANPWSLAFLPNGDMLVTERAGRLRVIRGGTLAPKPITGVPAARVALLGGLLEVALHPKFAENGYVYLSYSKSGEKDLSTTAIARGRLKGDAIEDVRDIFVANSWSSSTTNYGGRMAFDRNGFLYLSVGERQEQDRAQKGDDHGGKVLRLRDDGSVPADNPFAGKSGYAPEVFSLGHRSPQGLAVHPETGAIWENEHGPLGGDEVNIVLPGRNYGWPLVTFGMNYDGTKISDATWRADLEPPLMYWVPSIAISGLTFYTGDRFPNWKGNAFVGSMFEGRTRATGHVQRITFENGRPIQREPMLTELHQRIRDIRQGPDGLLYVLTDENPGVVLKIEPVQ